MGNVSVERTIDLPVTQLWAAMKDVGTIQNFNPFVKVSKALTAETGGVDAERRCDFHDGNWVNEKVVGWDEGRSMTISIYEGSMPVTDALAKIALHSQSPTQTRVTFEMSYVPKMGPLGKLMDMMMMRSKFTSMLENVLAGLETHVRTGAVVGRDGKPEASVAIAA